jgi:SAM-dependent methyltransferase
MTDLAFASATFERMRQDDGRDPGGAAASTIRAFYERYPYPRPVQSLDAYRALWQDPQRRRAEHYLHRPRMPYRDDGSILVAGCGTSQAAKHALRWPGARVTGIDFSETSVRCTNELKRKYGLANLDVHQLPIERVRELGTTFDRIVCTGVLHHLPRPDEGLRALRAVLEPQGTLDLMVYAPYGRTGIYMMQEYCRRLGMDATDADIQSLVGTLKHLPAAHPLHTLLREAPDFRNPAALADALLNPQDRAYSVPQLFELIRAAGLAFSRFTRQAPYSTRCGALTQLPQRARIEALAAAEQFAVAEIFRGTMLRHSVIAFPTDAPHDRCVVDLSRESWQQLVPIRMPDTVVVTERVPPGAVAVLLNCTHTDRDLYMPIDAADKSLFDAIDGLRSMGEIASAHGDVAGARSFFERLWWHDQIAVDATGSRSPG